MPGPAAPRPPAAGLLVAALLVADGPALRGQEGPPKSADKPAAQAYPKPPEGAPPPVPIADAEAPTPEAMRAYTESIPGTDVTFRMVPIPGGRFWMGSPEDEPGRKQAEGPRHQVELDPFWMGRTEVTWDEYHEFMLRLDLQRRAAGEAEAVPQDAWADAVSRPTPPYVPMDEGMGTHGYPAVGMTQFAAKQYTKWLSMKTGRFYRLPTEAEWEYACRAGTDTAYSFGDDPAQLDEYAWYFDNADDRYHKVGTKKPNPWGLYDMHGNVAEWCLDQYDSGFYATLAGKVVRNPIRWPDRLYPRVVRGGSWDDDPEDLRSAARRPSRKSWKVRDPQIPKSIWYHTDAPFLGFRVVRPFRVPPPEEQARYWDPDVDEIREVYLRQRRGER